MRLCLFEHVPVCVCVCVFVILLFIVLSFYVQNVDLDRLVRLCVLYGTRYYIKPIFWAAGRRPYIVFTFTGSVRNVRNDV